MGAAVASMSKLSAGQRSAERMPDSRGNEEETKKLIGRNTYHLLQHWLDLVEIPIRDSDFIITSLLNCLFGPSWRHTLRLANHTRVVRFYQGLP